MSLFDLDCLGSARPTATGNPVRNLLWRLLPREENRVLRRLALIPLLFVLNQASAANKDFGGASMAFTGLARERVDLTQVDLKTLQQRATEGDAAAQAELGFLYLYGHGVPKDPADAFEWTQKAVDQGNTRAMLVLAQMYMTGQGVPRDPQRAFAAASKAASLGSVAGQGCNALQYILGYGVAQDLNRGKAMLADAASKGDLNSMVTQGILAAVGDDYNYETAAAALGKAAQAGDSAGEFYLARVYVAQKKFDAAHEWLQKSAAQGYPDAERVIGEYSHFGFVGFAQDDQQAVLWLHKAAEHGDAQAESDLGALYYQGGQGVPQDKQQGLLWLHKAVDHGSQNAKQMLAQVEH
jgi:uncharacterized protein